MLRGFFVLLFFIVIDVRLLALREPVHEEGFVTAPEKDDRPIAFRFSLSWSGDPLFYDLTTKISIDLALFGAINGLSQGRIFNPFLPGKALKPL